MGQNPNFDRKLVLKAPLSGETLWRNNCQFIGLPLIQLGRQAQKVASMKTKQTGFLLQVFAVSKSIFNQSRAGTN